MAGSTGGRQLHMAMPHTAGDSSDDPERREPRPQRTHFPAEACLIIYITIYVKQSV